MINTDRAWEKWGRNDPYFGVLAEERFSAERIDEHRDEFFASGQAAIKHILKRLERSFGALPRGRALDHGCGVGRLSLPLARTFAQVTGLDISPSMLAEARSNATRLGLNNVGFELADDQLSRAAGQYEFVNSHLVLQHVPVRRGLPILARLLDKIAPGGGFHIDFSVRSEGIAPALLYWSSANLPGVKIIQNVLAHRQWNAPAMQMNHYPLARVVDLLAAHGVREFQTSNMQYSRFMICSLVGRKSELPAR